MRAGGAKVSPEVWRRPGNGPRMMNTPWLTLFGLGFCLVPLWAQPANAGPPPAAVPDCAPAAAWRALQAERLLEHPLVVAARHALERERQDLAAVDGYFDTRLTAAVGAASWTRAVPGSSYISPIAANRLAVQAGLERAVLPGAVLAAGAAQRRLLEADDDDLYESLAGVQLRVPLWRNRGLADWHWEQNEAGALAAAAAHRLDAVRQQLLYESDAAFIDLQQAQADLEAYRRAAARVDRLVAEAEALTALLVIPEYQLFPARLDASLRAEQVAEAEHRCFAIRTRLDALLGPLPELAVGAAPLLAWAGRVEAPVRYTVEDALARRGTAQELQAAIDAATAAERRARNAIRPDLSAVLGGTWQVEDPDGAWGGDALLDDEPFGYDAALVLSLPLERRRERAAWNAARSRTAEWRALLAQERRQVARELDAARDAVRQADRRFRLVDSAVANAAGALQAEAERFRLGEGRSRNVLDAQKDLTDAELRRHAAAGALLRAHAALAFAAGYPGDPPPIPIPGSPKEMPAHDQMD
jgi:outer membrane protein TolC